MTCIVAIKGEDTICMGGDSAGVSGDTIYYRLDEKVFINGPMIFGFTASFRMGQILRYHLKVPEQKCEDDLEFLCTDFIDDVIKTLEKNGFGNIIEGRKNGGTFLIGYKENIYMVHNDYQIAKHYENYAAIGCGKDYAKGCLYTLSNCHEMTSQNKISCALDAASYHSCWVSAPYIIKELKHGVRDKCR